MLRQIRSKSMGQFFFTFSWIKGHWDLCTVFPFYPALISN